MQSRCGLTVFCLATVFQIFCLAAVGQTRVQVNPSDQRQVFEGWGTSLAWWAHDLGAWRQESIDAIATLVADTLTGLGMNVYRYNLGGGDAPGHAHMRNDADIPGFRPTETGAYDWNADAYQQKVLEALVRRTPKPILEAFSCSPPWWMTQSGCTSGHVAGANNLKEDYYDDFADYLTEAVKHLRDSNGITFRTLEPFNEPNSPWWKANGTQEGCHFDQAAQARLIQEVGLRLKRKGILGTSVSASDANSIGEMIGNANGYDAITLSFISQFNVHSYAGSEAERRSLRDVAARLDKRLWQSETGPLWWPGGDQFDAAMWSADLILKDLREMRAQAWVDWQVAGGGIWGAIDYDFAAQTSKMNKKGFAYAQFSRFIRPGSTVVGSDHPGTLAALVHASGSLVLVLVNSDSSEAAYAFDLSRFQSLPTSAKVYRTSSNQDMAQLLDLLVMNKTVTVNAPSRSITTLILSGAITTRIGVFKRRSTWGEVMGGAIRNPHSSHIGFRSLDRAGFRNAAGRKLISSGSRIPYRPGVAPEIPLRLSP